MVAQLSWRVLPEQSDVISRPIPKQVDPAALDKKRNLTDVKEAIHFFYDSASAAGERSACRQFE